ncbi:MAG: 50S ribosomal protein L3 [Candidatus Magasanikbacteria bacterium CG_4_10_14_0_2_um_filter_37_12]|uniref:Large ribosomal subunit protein uL3 n=1 Tax=Candidatus Magasanikbacteria bacterium CG_4_10_14_0_2_um_filter_37_12 TaxID=1974637 RepID=A0A2M7V8P0_9BACT|nr:MAG: 50S ribosomal protein L3 [Candidatus Magasanikbacteria bacterium CG_4_10_14_0_2_um_filter_37_12]
MRFILGTKLNMTQVFREDGTVVPVTKVHAGPCVVTQVKSLQKDGTNAVQVGFGTQKSFRVNKAQQGHLKDLETVRKMREFTVDNDQGLRRGDVFTVQIFNPGDKVEVVGTSKGKGFQGVVKRHGFHGSPASHGHKDQLRMPGSIGAAGVQRVFKGTRMGGHTGDERVTIKNLEILEVDLEKNELFIKGAVPGARGGLLMISTKDGVIETKSDDRQVNVDNGTEVVEVTNNVKELEVEATKEVSAEVVEESKVEESKVEEKTETEEEVKTSAQDGSVIDGEDK